MNTCDFIDADTTPILAMSSSAAYSNAVGWNGPANYLATFGRTASAAGGSYRGFGLVTTPAAYQAGTGTNAAVQAATFLQQLASAQMQAPFGDGRRLVAATLPNGEAVSPPNQCLATPYPCLPERVNLGATALAALVDQKVNPLNPAIAPVTPSSAAVNFRCVDEKSQIQALDRTQPMLPMQ